MNDVKKLRTQFERFCLRHRNWGIPNLMLFVFIGTALVYLMSVFNDNYILYPLLCFNRELILQGQVWRLITYIFTDFRSSPLLTILFLFCYYSISRSVENRWGTFRFNLYYFSGVLLMDIYCMIFGGMAVPDYLHLSLFLAYSTLYPDSQFLLFFIIPVRAWVFALVDVALTLYGLIAYPFPTNLFGVVALANYFLFFGGDIINILPPSLRRKLMYRKKPKSSPSAPGPTITFTPARPAKPIVKQDYTHRCTVCGRTDVSNPEMEFRYCSRCNGYHCYCEEHIRNHSHIE
jgi:hypothetical protein